MADGHNENRFSSFCSLHNHTYQNIIHLPSSIHNNATYTLTSGIDTKRLKQQFATITSFNVELLKTLRDVDCQHDFHSYNKRIKECIPFHFSNIHSNVLDTLTTYSYMEQLDYFFLQECPTSRWLTIFVFGMTIAHYFASWG